MKLQSILVPMLFVAFFSCDFFADESPSGTENPPTLSVVADITYYTSFGFDPSIWLSLNGRIGTNSYMGEALTDAQVSINGIPLEIGIFEGHYSEPTSDLDLSPGDSFTLSVLYQDWDFQIQGQIPPEVDVLSPANGTEQDSEQPIEVSWNALTPPPHSLEMSISGMFTTRTGEDYEVDLDPSSTSHTIPAQTFKPDLGDFALGPKIDFIAINEYDFNLENVDPDSFMMVTMDTWATTFFTSP